MRIAYYIIRMKYDEYIPYILLQYKELDVYHKSAWRLKRTRFYKTEEQAEAFCKKYIIHRIDYYPWSYMGRVGGSHIDLYSLPILQEAKPFWPKYNHKRTNATRPHYKLRKLKI